MLAEFIKKKFPDIEDGTISIISSGFDYAVECSCENNLRDFDNIEILQIVNKAKEWIIKSHPEMEKTWDFIFEDIEVALDDAHYMTLDGNSFFDWLFN